jgi:hypothetical protein
LGKAYCPEEFVAVVLISLVAVFVKLTAASGTTAPAGSVTIPKTRAEFEVCAHTGAADNRTASKALATKILVKNFILPPTTESVCEQGRSSRRNGQTRQKSKRRHRS